MESKIQDKDLCFDLGTTFFTKKTSDGKKEAAAPIFVVDGSDFVHHLRFAFAL